MSDDIASTYHRRQSWGVGGRDPPNFEQGGRRGVVGIVDGSYHVQEVYSKVVTFEEKSNNFPRNSCK